jgi:hypothetical protein
MQSRRSLRSFPPTTNSSTNIPQSILARSHTDLIQYFDPTRGADGQSCKSILGIGRSVLEKAHRDVQAPLDKKSAAAARLLR